MITKQKKKEMFEEVRELLKGKEGIYFVDFTGINAIQFNNIRRTFGEKNIKLKVVKNTILKRVLDEVRDKNGYDIFLKGPNAVIFSENPVEPAKLLKELKKEFSNLEFKGAIVEDNIFTNEDFEYLAKLSDKDSMRAILLGVLQSPMRNLLFVLNAKIMEFVLLLDNIKNKKEEK